MTNLNINKEKFNEMINSNQTVLIDFYAEWCGPCKMLSPIINQIAQENENILVGKVNIDEQINLAQEYQVESIPTLLVFKNGQLVNRSVGFQGKPQILEMLK